MQYETRPLAEGDAEELEAKLDAFDRAAMPTVSGISGEEIVLKIEDSAGGILAGCTAWIDSWGYLDLAVLWVDERYRGQGFGTALHREMLRFAKEKGCYLATVGAFSFQTSEFYRKQGFTVCETIENCPQGHTHHCLFLRLDREMPDCPEKTPEKRFAIRRGDAHDAEYLLKQFYAYSEAVVPRLHPYLPFDKKCIDEAGRLIAGIVAGVSGWNIGYADLLWVEEPYRNRGLGSALLSAVEREVKAHGGTVILATAFDRQAEFFRKNGYRTVGVIEDFPKGHCWYSLTKEL